MRILFLALDVDLSKQRGDTIHVVELARAWRALGHDVAVLVGSDGPARALLPFDVVFHVAHGSGWNILATVLSVLRGFPAEVIYERRYTPKIGYVVHFLSRLPYVMEVNGVLKDELAFQNRRVSNLAFVKDRVRTFLLRRVDRFVAVSRAVAQDLVSSYGVDSSMVRVIGNGVNTERFRPIDKQEACRRLGLDAGRPRLLFVGNIVPWRDFDVMVHAMVSLTRESPDPELLIVGTGQERGRIEAMVRDSGLSDRVRFLGEVPHEEVPLFIGSADFCLLPAKRWSVDISPLKLFEYLACGRPVVASRVPGMELVEAEGVGRLVQPGDPKDLASALVDLLRDPEARRSMGARGRTFVEKERSWDAVAARVVAVLEEAAGLAS